MTRSQRKRLKKLRRLLSYRRKPRKKLPQGYTRHHRKCKSHGGGLEKGNISIVKENAHRAFHLLFENHSAFRIAEILNDVWLDTRYKLVVVERKHDTRPVPATVLQV